MEQTNDEAQYSTDCYNYCYQYPIKLEQNPLGVALAGNGSILIFKESTIYNHQTQSNELQICYYDKHGKKISSIMVSSFFVIRYMIFFEEQINLILDLNQIQTNQLSNDCLEVKWNFKKFLFQQRNPVDINHQIRVDKKIFFQYENPYYCILRLELYSGLGFIRKIQVNFYQSSKNIIRDEPFSKLLIDLSKDDLFNKCSYNKLRIQPCILQKNPAISFRQQNQGEEEISEIKYIVLKQDKKISFEVDDDQMSQNNDQNEINQQDQQFQSMIIEEETQIVQKDCLLLYKESFQLKQKRVQVVDDWKDVIEQKSGPENSLFIKKFCHTPKSLSSISPEVFIGKDEIFISIEKYKIPIVFILENMIERCCEDLVQKILDLLFLAQVNWRE